MLLYMCLERNQDLPDFREQAMPGEIFLNPPEGLEDYVPLPPDASFAAMEDAQSSDGEQDGKTDEWAHALLRRLQAQRGLQSVD